MYTQAWDDEGLCLSVEFYEIPFHLLYEIIGNDTYSGISGRFEPAHMTPEVTSVRVAPKPTPQTLHVLS